MTTTKHKIKSNKDLVWLFIIIVFFNASFFIAYDMVKGIGKKMKLQEEWWHSLIILIILLGAVSVALFFANDFEIMESSDDVVRA